MGNVGKMTPKLLRQAVKGNDCATKYFNTYSSYENNFKSIHANKLLYFQKGWKVGDFVNLVGLENKEVGYKLINTDLRTRGLS